MAVLNAYDSTRQNTLLWTQKSLSHITDKIIGL